MIFYFLFLFSVVSPALSSVLKEEIHSCSPTEFFCHDGGCISSDLVCDGTRNCADGTDEAACGLSDISLSPQAAVLDRSKRQASARCRKNQWQCRDGSCISFDGKCDGVVDCPDGSDETHALCRKMRCQHNWFRCTYGACVDGTAACNGVQECADNSDELLPRCRNETDEVRGQFHCLDGSAIPAANHCDGVRDCPDGSDETVRACAAKTCPSYLFQCAYGACVDSGADCNGMEECADGSDEAPDLCNKSGPAPTPTVKPPKPGNCVLPAYPEHGSYITNIPNGKPGDAYDVVTLNVTCNHGYGVVGSNSIYCVNGWWPESMPKCVRMCRLQQHPSVEYSCLVTGAVTGHRPCNAYEPDGTVVSPQCRTPNYYSATTLTFMRCLQGNWDYIARCTPGLTKNGTNITILIKDEVELHVSDIQYVVPIKNNQNIVDLGSISNNNQGTEDFGSNIGGNNQGSLDFDANLNEKNQLTVIPIKNNESTIGLGGNNQASSVNPEHTTVNEIADNKPIYIDPNILNQVFGVPNISENRDKEISNSNGNNYDVDERMGTNNNKWGGNEPNSECGRVTPKGEQLVIGGREADRGEIPWHAGIYRKTTNPYMQICGGSLISNTIVISAAHCFWNDIVKQLPATDYAVAVGKIYRPWNNKMDDAQKSDVREIKMPVRFQGAAANFQDDIAIVIVTTAFEYKTYVRPVCVDFDINFERRQLQPGKIGKVAGWGLTAENGKESQILKVLDVPYVSIETCITESPPGFREYITSDKICAGYKDAGSALCKGDSGGGLAFPESDKGTERYYLRGIVSTAPNNENLCNANTYTSFTQLLKHEHFVKEYWTES